MAVEFKDNSIQVKAAINKATIAWLEETAGEIEAQAKIGSTRDKQVKSSWKHTVNDKKGEATIGSPLINAIWEEFGTGSHALHKDGRPGWWVYVKDGDVHSSSPNTYTEKEAKAVAASMRAQGLDAHATNGQKPLRTLFNAFNNVKPGAMKRFAEIMKENLDEK